MQLLLFGYVFCELVTLTTSTARSSLQRAGVVLENHTGYLFKFQVEHQYTDDNIEQSDWIRLAPGERKKIMDVHFRYGWLTTGRDNWKVHGIPYHKVEGKTTGIISIDGAAYVEGLPWKSWHGFLAEWKMHTLRKEDADKDTVIKVHPSAVYFHSESGTSSTRWDGPTDGIGRPVKKRRRHHVFEQ